jgi:RNA polymerase sigma-70 factor (ECF subfamily)
MIFALAALKSESVNLSALKSFTGGFYRHSDLFGRIRDRFQRAAAGNYIDEDASMPHEDADTDGLLTLVADGHGSAADALLRRHRNRLAAMVRLRMDRRLDPRIDPSDVVQDTLTEAYGKLPNFAKARPMPFYPWLRCIAWERLIQLHREHILAERRSVKREEQFLPLPAESEAIVADRLAASATGVTGGAVRKEVRGRVRAAIAELPLASQEVVILRHLEELRFKEISAVLRISETAVYSRYRRAVEQLAKLLKADQ